MTAEQPHEMTVEEGAAKLKAHGEQMRRDFPSQPCAFCVALRAALEQLAAEYDQQADNVPYAADQASARMCANSIRGQARKLRALLTAPPQEPRT